MVLDYRQAEKRAREALDEYSIKTSGKSGIKTPVKLMSGGNQQKVILSREISGEAGLIVASQPQGDWISEPPGLSMKPPQAEGCRQMRPADIG